MRFQVKYNIGKGLSHEEVHEKLDNLDNQELKIVDEEGVLPNLIIKDKSVGKLYVDYMNQPSKEEEIIRIKQNIEKTLDKLNDMNLELVQPKKEISYYTEDDEPVYDFPLRTKLFVKGYNKQVDDYTMSIRRDLNHLKRLLVD